MSSIRTLSRRACKCGVSAVFSSPPPASPTFAVAPGGVAILAKQPLSIRKLRPESLEVWEKKGRVLCACIPGKVPVYLVGVYGFPPSHEESCNNDAMFACCFQWAAEWREPVLILGDFNESFHSLSSLSLSHQWCLWRATDDAPTTPGKTSRLAGGAAIDHVLANRPAYDILVSCQVQYELALSDH